MSAPKGNQFWKLRSKHGRDKLFETPQLMWRAACEYFQWCEDNPLYELKVFGTGLEKKVPKMRAMTLSGLCFYLNCNEVYFNQFESALDKDKKIDQDFSKVIKEIRAIIYNQKFTGAAADLLNANIIARDLGLSDTQKINHDVNVKGLPDITIKSTDN